MKEATRQFRDGEVIFREGDESLAVFRVERGRVRLVKAGGNGGGVMLAVLGRGEMFGEMGILDGVARNASAVAEGDATLTVIPRAAFLDRLQSDSELSLRVMTKLVQRLRAADERLARAMPADLAQAVAPAPPPVPEPEPERTPRAGLLRRLFARRAAMPVEAEAPQSAGPLRILVARFSDMPAVESTSVEQVAQALNLVPGALVRRLDEIVPWPEDDVRDPEAARLAAHRAALALLAKAGGDVLIWGRVEPIGRLLEVHVAAAAAPHELRLGRVPPVAAVGVPLEATPEPLAALIRALAVAAPLAEGVRRGGNLLPSLAEDVVAAAEGLKRAVAGFAAAEQGAAWVGWAAAASLAAGAEGAPDTLWDDAARAFEDAARRLPRAARADWADVFIGRALLECARVERGAAAPPPEGTPWDAAADTLRLALEGVRREERPFEWALLHERLGLIAYRQALAGGEESAFKTALAHYQSAIQVYTRADMPQRWAEVVSALAQALQVFGDQVGSAAALERAVELIRATLDVRSEETAPLLWAASQNNLGSALFLLAKRRDSAALFEDAAAAFRNALGTYQIHGQGRLAAVTEKNLARAADAARSRARRDGRLAQPEWAEEAVAGDLENPP